MKKLIIMVAAAVLGGSVYAQGSGPDTAVGAGQGSQYRPDMEPGSNVYLDRSGNYRYREEGPPPRAYPYSPGWAAGRDWRGPEAADGRDRRGPGVAEGRDWRGPRPGDHERGRVLNRTSRDRDGDGVPNNVDRYPNDPSRW